MFCAASPTTANAYGRGALDLVFDGDRAFDPRIKFTRDTVATRTNSAGLIETVPINLPRLDYDPITLACKGLLIEEARTNLLTYSEQFDNAAWTKARSSISANAVTAPDGTLTADKLVEDTSASTSHLVYAASYSATSVTLTASVYAKAGERTKFAIEISNFVNSAPTSVFDLVAVTAGAVSGAGVDYSATSSGIQAVGNGWFRCWLTATKGTSNSTNVVAIDVANAAGSILYTGDGTSGLYLWGAQLEAGAFATSYIPTTASQATRAADVAVMTGANFSDWYRQDEGTFVVEAQRTNSGNFVSYPYLFQASDGTYPSSLGIYGVDGSKNITNALIFGGVSQLDYVDGITSASVFKLAFSIKANNTQMVFDGVPKVTDTSCSAPTVNKINIGAAFNGTAQMCCWLKRFTYYPTRLASATLQALTA
jgi:hypothetical protein